MGNRFSLTLKVSCLILFFGFSLTNLKAQDGSQKINSKFKNKQDTTLVKNDSIKIDTLNYKIANTDIKDKITYEATDSIVYNAETKTFILYKNGKINYTDIELKADYIQYNTDSSLLVAYPTDTLITDSTIKPTFKQGEQLFTYDSLKYNFKSERALVTEAYTQYGEGFIISEQVKRNKDKSIYGLKNIYTTCDLETPHFGISAKKIKVIPDVVGISGPARFVIENIPTPLYIPFGIYPLLKGQRAGFIIPQYGFEQQRGFALRQGGYYFPISEYIDLKVLGDLYSYGSWRVGTVSTYLKKYNYSGSFNFDFSNNILESELNTKSNANRTFAVGWRHTIDPKKLNNSTFSASVNIASGNNNRFNFNQNLQNYLQNNLNSTISYSKNWPGKPYSLTATLRHSQDNITRKFDLSLPEINFNANNLTPFARKDIVGKLRWYEKINFNYTSILQNQISFYDTAFSFRQINPRNFNNGIKHNLRSAYNTKILKYFNFNVSANYNEYWYSKQSFRNYNFAEKRQDTLLKNGFFAARDFDAGAALTTNIFGTKIFKKGPLKGIRHTAIPSVSFSYNPNFGDNIADYWYDAFIDSLYRTARISYFELSNLIGIPRDRENGNINFDIRNSLQAKYLSKKDTSGVAKKINILDNFNVGTSYNLAADSLNWSPVRFNFSTNLFSNKISILGNGNYDVYARDTGVSNRLINTFYYTQTKKPLNFRSLSLNIGTNFRSKPKENNNKKTITEDEKRSLGNDLYNYTDFNIPYEGNLNINFGVDKNYSRVLKRDTLRFRADLNFNFGLTLTQKWRLNAGSGYDFISKQVSTTNISISRDLHCWEMSFGVIPFGEVKSYNFTLAPKSSMLHDLRVVRNKSFWDYR